MIDYTRKQATISENQEKKGTVRLDPYELKSSIMNKNHRISIFKVNKNVNGDKNERTKNV